MINSVEQSPDDELSKAPRLPRWTRQELLVLIQGKRVAENRVHRGWNPSGPPSPLTVSIMGLTAGLFNAGKDGAIWPGISRKSKSGSLKSKRRLNLSR
ncbi:hypothetical protein R6Q59_027700 [Mikania micrantha]